MGCFAENRHMVFLWKLPDKSASDVLQSGCLREHMMVGKGVSITQQPVDDSVALVHLATLGWSLLGFADDGFRR